METEIFVKDICSSLKVKEKQVYDVAINIFPDMQIIPGQTESFSKEDGEKIIDALKSIKSETKHQKITQELEDSDVNDCFTTQTLPVEGNIKVTREDVAEMKFYPEFREKLFKYNIHLNDLLLELLCIKKGSILVDGMVYFALQTFASKAKVKVKYLLPSIAQYENTRSMYKDEDGKVYVLSKVLKYIMKARFKYSICKQFKGGTIDLGEKDKIKVILPEDVKEEKVDNEKENNKVEETSDNGGESGM